MCIDIERSLHIFLSEKVKLQKTVYQSVHVYIHVCACVCTYIGKCMEGHKINY